MISYIHWLATVPAESDISALLEILQLRVEEYYTVELFVTGRRRKNGVGLGTRDELEGSWYYPVNSDINASTHTTLSN
jgi:hypothetical protein